MILTGDEIAREVERGHIVIEPFDRAHLEPNSYGFRLNDDILSYSTDVLSGTTPLEACRERIPTTGKVLEPGRLYLCSTLEVMGSTHYAATLYARRSVSTLGMWIQVEAPLGHTGAIVQWTLEVRTTSPLRIYAGMLIGKVAFWQPRGDRSEYLGHYAGSRGAVSSRLYLDRARDAEPRTQTSAQTRKERSE